jgi:O-methyltransferase
MTSSPAAAASTPGPAPIPAAPPAPTPAQTEAAHPVAGSPAGTVPADLRDRYLDLLRDTLTFRLWDGRDGSVWTPRPAVRRIVDRAAAVLGIEIIKRMDGESRAVGMDWPRLAHTMIGYRRLRNLQDCVERVLADGVPGDLIETGVWRGGSCILMRGVLAAHGDTERTVWVADSFAGLPPPDPARYPVDAGDTHHQQPLLAVSLAEVQENFRRYGLLDERVRFLRGWFRDTLPGAPIDRLAVLRLDGDMYESTMEALTVLYPKLSPSGFCVVDDYGVIEGCRAAVEDYRREHGIVEEIVRVDSAGVYWRRD